MENNYTDDKIQTMKWNEHIRRRPGMYIGRLGNGDNQGDGIYVLLKETIDNSVDEFSMGYGKQIQVTINDREVTVRDFGRGIPLDSVVKVTNNLNTGGKFDDRSFKKSVGLNGVGSKAVNALSSSYYVQSFRDGLTSWAKYERGELLDSGKSESTEKNGTLVVFTPDVDMFGDFAFNMDFVETLIKNYSYLKKGLQLVLNGTAYKSENGLLDLVSENMSETPLYPLIHLEGDDIEIVMTHGNSYGENIVSFVNGQNTRDGGTHLNAFREAIAKTLKEFYKKNYESEDIRQGVVGAISIQM
jgi:topoisomerase-4 subunit B